MSNDRLSIFVCCLCVLFCAAAACGAGAGQICASTSGAGDPNRAAPDDQSSSMSDSMERILHPEISYLRERAKARYAAPEKRERAREIIERWDNGVVEPEPVLFDAWLERGKLDEYTGRMVYGSLSSLFGGVSGTAPPALNLLAVDEDDDLLGIRIREEYVLPSGVESSFQEMYPAYIDEPEKAPFGGGILIPVHFRRGNRVKDESRWQAYVDHVRRAGDSEKMAKPPIWITEPDPNAVAVTVSVYDSKGHESRGVPVRLISPEPDVDAVLSQQQAIKEYGEKGVELARWPDEAIKPRANNAALLYYRAMACQPRPDPCTARIMNLMHSGREPDDRVREHLGQCLNTIQLAQLASQIPECNWGLVDDPLWEHTTTTMSSFRRLGSLLGTYARTLAADGHYRAALENCLVNRRFARHIGDDTYHLFCTSHSTNYIALRGILDILAKMPSNEETLKWLRDRLITVEGIPLRPAAAFNKWRDQEVAEWRLYDGDRPFSRQWAMAQIEDEAEREVVVKLTDEQLLVSLLSLQRTRRDRQYGLDVPGGLLVRACKELDTFIASAVHAMESDLPYKQKQARLEELERELHDNMERCGPVALLQCAPTDVATYHRFMVSQTAFLNCVNVALAVLLVQAETGQLPAAIPEGLPKDPFSGKDFGYERTKDGFVLRFDPERVGNVRLREFEFKVLTP